MSRRSWTRRCSVMCQNMSNAADAECRRLMALAKAVPGHLPSHERDLAWAKYDGAVAVHKAIHDVFDGHVLAMSNFEEHKETL